MLEYDPAGEGQYARLSPTGEAVLQRDEESQSVLKAVYIIVSEDHENEK